MKSISRRSPEGIYEGNKYKLLAFVLAGVVLVQFLESQWQSLSSLPVRDFNKDDGLVRDSNDDDGEIAVASAGIDASIIKDPYTSYKGAQVEEYVLEHADDLGYNSEQNPPGCSIWRDESPILQKLTAFRDDLKRYQQLVHDFPDASQDIRTAMKTSSIEQVCSELELHPDGLPGIFTSGQLSFTRSGWVEPLLTPLRHPEFCGTVQEEKREAFMSLGYLVQDFARMCRSVKPTSKIVLIDMGAALDFHANADSPAIYLTKTYRKFGFHFDHIYAFEIKEKVTQQVYERVPDELMASYHWINLGVDATTDSKFNPLHSILGQFDKDDLVIVKLDIDTPFIEIPLAYQLLNDTSLSDLVDQFYFEHHVHLGELASSWKTTMQGTIKSSLELFQGLRKNGVAAHYWP